MVTIFINFLLAFSAKLGYGGILFLMTIESSFIPFPSELVIPPASYLAQQGEMNIFLVIAFGVIGSLTGALVNYYLAVSLGRMIVYKLADSKIAKILLVNSKKIERAESFFRKHGRVSTFTGRLIPVIRQLISLPAGFSKMKIKVFCFYTFLGSSIWVIILALLGYSFGANQELLNQYLEEITLVAVLLILIFISGYALKNGAYKKIFKFWKNN